MKWRPSLKAVWVGDAMKRWIGLVAVLAAAFALFYDGSRTPPPLPADAPATAFSAARALVHVAALAPVPHPVGSPANARDRDELMARMSSLGLSPRVQRAASHRVQLWRGEPFAAGAVVENVIGLLPGKDPSLPALALMAHYDSVAGSPGAADDIAGTASALEVIRALKARGQPERDVVVLITDGEEADLLGAQAFFDRDPLARHIGFVLNLEARGGGGRPAMFETGAGNGPAIDLYRRVTRRPNANSLTVFIYKKLPNDTDYTVVKGKGIAGLNYAFIGRQFDYHSPSSTVAALDQGAVQDMGDQVLDAAQGLAFARQLPATQPDRVYFSLFGRWMIAYPPAGGWAVLAMAALLLAVAAVRAGRATPIRWADVVRGAGATLLVLSLGLLTLHLARHATGFGFGWYEGRGLLARFAPYEIAMAAAGLGGLILAVCALALGGARVLAALLVLTLGLASSLFGGFDAVALGEAVAAAALFFLLAGSPLDLAASWLGLMGVAGLAALGLQIAAPTTAFVVSWPLLVAALCAALSAGGRGRQPLVWGVVLILITLDLAWLCDLFHLTLQALDMPEPPVMPLWLASLVLWPLVWPDRARPRSAIAPGALLLLAGLCLSLGLHLTRPWSPRHPAAAEPLYVVDAAAQRAWRVSPFEPEAWTRGVLTAEGGAIARRSLPGFRSPAWAAPAPLAPALAPDIRVTPTPDGRVTVAIAPMGDTVVNLDLRLDTFARDVRLDGEPADLLSKPGVWSHLHWESATQGPSLSFQPLGHGRLEIRYAGFKPGWPPSAKALPPMPRDVMAWDMSGATVAVGTRETRW